jgi:hypothetical protein
MHAAYQRPTIKKNVIPAKELVKESIFQLVIASRRRKPAPAKAGAIQRTAWELPLAPGLLRRFAPRNDGPENRSAISSHTHSLA